MYSYKFLLKDFPLFNEPLISSKKSANEKTKGGVGPSQEKRQQLRKKRK